MTQRPSPCRPPSSSAAACAAPADSAAPTDGMEGMAGIIVSGLDVEDGLVGVGGVRHDFGVGLIRRLGLDQVGHLGPEIDHRVLHIALGIGGRVRRVVVDLPGAGPQLNGSRPGPRSRRPPCPSRAARPARRPRRTGPGTPAGPGVTASFMLATLPPMESIHVWSTSTPVPAMSMPLQMELMGPPRR